MENVASVLSVIASIVAIYQAVRARRQASTATTEFTQVKDEMIKLEQKFSVIQNARFAGLHADVIHSNNNGGDGVRVVG
jgi:Tfp pilus assembly major pilin PilA